LTVYDCCILGCMLLNIATKGSIASFETLGIAIAEEYFAMAASRAGIIIACCGVCGVVALLNLGMLEQRFTDVHIITGGMLVMIVGIASLIDDAKFKNPGWTYGLSMFLIYSVGYPIGHTAVIGLFSKSTLCL
jgi:MFS transporter, ceroid-lipofuscinosis neuronal protein 7